jgi:nucleotide-binding universal stress UspA family protein
MASQRRFEELTLQNPTMGIKSEFMVKFGIASEQILQVSHDLKADLIIFGSKHHAYIETESHMPWAAAYKVVCGARCPVLTIRN